MTIEPNTTRIVIADKQPVVRQDVRRFLESNPGFSIAGEASEADGTADLVRRMKPDVLLIDLDLCRELKMEPPGGSLISSPTRMLAMVGSIQKNDIVSAFLLGAHGIVLKGSIPLVLLQSIRSVTSGQYWLDNESLAVLVEAMREVLSHRNRAGARKDYGLTRRELDIITKIVSGCSNKEVGEDFSISERTVKHHLTNIFCKVGVTNRLQLALFAVSHDLSNAAALALRQSGEADLNPGSSFRPRARAQVAE